MIRRYDVMTLRVNSFCHYQLTLGPMAARCRCSLVVYASPRQDRQSEEPLIDGACVAGGSGNL